MKRIYPKESEEQAALFQWAAINQRKYPALRLLIAIPNGGSRNPIEAANLKRQGVKPGVSDMFLSAPCGGYHGMYIELKRKKGGRLSEEQEEWIQLTTEAGYFSVVAYGYEEARDNILLYLGLEG